MKKWVLLAFVPCFALAQDFTTGPRFTYFEVSLGEHMIETDSDIFQFNEENLLFDPGSLDGLDFGFGFHWQRGNILSMGMLLKHYSESVLTEDRYYTYADGTPVYQTIDFEKTYIGVDVTVTPFGAGERFGTKAWAPKQIVPFVRIGAGVLSWDYFESGDFVDYDEELIFYDAYGVSGTAFAIHVGAGLRVKLTPRLDGFLNYTYTNADDTMSGGDFIGFGDLDLSSQSASIGINFKVF